jgi:heme-degrading monooxygenase HmoA
MYIERREVRVVGGRMKDFLAFNEALHAGMKTMPGFRWAMLLRSMGYPGKMATIDMWQTREQARDWAESEAQQAVFAAHPLQGMVSPISMAHGYDVVTARGPMTPAAVVAVVDWEIDVAAAKPFTDRWNAAYHAIEDKLGSRLLRHLSQPTALAGVHVAQAEADLAPEALAGEISAGESFVARPSAIDRFDVVLLTEA